MSRLDSPELKDRFNDPRYARGCRAFRPLPRPTIAPRHLAALALVVLAAWPAATAEQPAGGAPPPGDATPDAAARALLADLEERLLGAESLRVRYRITSEGAFASSLDGTLHFGEANQVELLAGGTFGDAAVQLHLRSDGREMSGGATGRTFTGEAPAALREALVVGWTRMGLLHNLARLSAGAPPDHAAGGVRDWVQPGEFLGEGNPPAAEPKALELSFRIVVAGQPSGEARLRLDRRSRLPERREQVVEFETGTMRVVEEYEFPPAGEAQPAVPPSDPAASVDSARGPVRP